MPFVITVSEKNPTPILVTINWNVSEVGSGAVRLVLKDASNVTLLDQESQASPANGTLTISQSQTPYSIQVSRTAGTEFARWRLCNDTDSVEVTSSFSITGSETYIVSPTPLTTTVNATYGNVFPLNCAVA